MTALKVSHLVEWRPKQAHHKRSPNIPTRFRPAPKWLMEGGFRFHVAIRHPLWLFFPTRPGARRQSPSTAYSSPPLDLKPPFSRSVRRFHHFQAYFLPSKLPQCNVRMNLKFVFCLVQSLSRLGLSWEQTRHRVSRACAAPTPLFSQALWSFYALPPVLLISVLSVLSSAVFYLCPPRTHPISRHILGPSLV